MMLFFGLEETHHPQAHTAETLGGSPLILSSRDLAIHSALALGFLVTSLTHHSLTHHNQHAPSSHVTIQALVTLI